MSDAPTLWTTTSETCVRLGVRNVVAHVGRFEQVLPKLGARPRSALEGAQDFASVLRDTELALGLVDPNGWFVWHDHGHSHFGVSAAVDAVAAEVGCDWTGVDHLV